MKILANRNMFTFYSSEIFIVLYNVVIDPTFTNIFNDDKLSFPIIFKKKNFH